MEAGPKAASACPTQHNSWVPLLRGGGLIPARFPTYRRISLQTYERRQLANLAVASRNHIVPPRYTAPHITTGDPT
jgi:hypothetical protein